MAFRLKPSNAYSGCAVVNITSGFVGNDLKKLMPYQSKTNLPVNQGGGFGPGGGPSMGASQSAFQGYIKSNYGVDIALQKNFLKNNTASVTLGVNDIFRTRRYDQYSESAFFIQNSYRLNDVPMIRLNLSFRFGQMDMSLFKRRNTKDESMQEATQSMGQ